MEVRYTVRQEKQVLYAGSWNQPDMDWDWETEETFFSNYDDAKKFYDSLKVSCDYPIIRLLEETLDRYGRVDDWTEIAIKD